MKIVLLTERDSHREAEMEGDTVQSVYPTSLSRKLHKEPPPDRRSLRMATSRLGLPCRKQEALIPTLSSHSPTRCWILITFLLIRYCRYPACP